MTGPLYVGGLDNVADALRHAAGALEAKGYPVAAARVREDAALVDALHADERRAAEEEDARRFREDEPTREIVPVLPPEKKETA